MAGERKIYSVADVNRKARMVLESGIGEIWVEGELSRVTIHTSGHWYFTLKDEQAAVSCAMFRNDNQRVTFRPQDGMKVQLYARPSVFESSGRYQLIAAEMEEAGKGDLQAQFEKLKARLTEEGLFDAERKKPLPVLPRKIGIVTSPTGAAIRDMINVLTRRFPNIQILLVPAKVQGAGAEEGIAKAIDYLNSRNDIDVLIVGRGGGSIEDLWNFNEEVVARAIARSVIPVISAVGHEIDFTISDFVADVRAPTPSAAAELAVREKTELEDTVLRYEQNLKNCLWQLVRDFQQRVDLAANSYVFREPGNLVRKYRQDIHAAETRIADLLKFSAQQRRQRLSNARIVMAHRLQTGLQEARQQIDRIGTGLRHRMVQYAGQERQRLTRLEDQLRVLNPTAVLGRGYSLTRRSDGSLVRSADSVDIGEQLVTQFADGKVVSNVAEKE
jgi:exodeoxyribonuclease VII large subunit